MEATQPHSLVGTIVLNLLIVASGLMEITFAKDGAGYVRQQPFFVIADPDGCRLSHINTVSAISVIDCATTCPSKDCSLFQYNTTAHKCHLYSDQPGGEGLQDDSKIFANEYYHKKMNAGWLLFVRRQDGSVDFNRTWADYRDGFGNGSCEFWLGLETLHNLTASQPYKLRAEMTDWTDTEYFAEYSTFQVGAESTAYTLSITGYDSKSTAGNAMIRHNGQNFTTWDMDNDSSGSNCADRKTGGWWFYSCAAANPTGTYYTQMTEWHDSVHWSTVPGLSSYYSFKTMTMMIQM